MSRKTGARRESSRPIGSALGLAALCAALGGDAILAQLPNLVPNAEFDDDTSGWDDPGTAGSLDWTSLDWSDCSGFSGSALLTNSAAGEGATVITGVCVPDFGGPGLVHSYGIRVRFSVGQTALGTATVMGRWVNSPTCAGSVVGEEFEEVVQSIPSGEWVRIFNDAVLPPPGAQGFHIFVLLDKVFAGDTLTMRIDGAYMVPHQGYLFADGFEYGDDCRWNPPS